MSAVPDLSLQKVIAFFRFNVYYRYIQYVYKILAENTLFCIRIEYIDNKH